MQRKWKRQWQRITVKLLVPPVAAGLLLLSTYTPAFANPTGSAVTSGVAIVATNGNSMTVTQTTGKVSINWQSFSISKGETVNFIQPGTSSVALNRVIGNNASTIYGNLNANGKVYLINSNGILFAPGSQVNVGGLVASTLNMTDSDFLNGKTTFGGSGAGSVTNTGTITAANEAVLIGPQVNNEGIIAAKVIGLAAGNKVSLDFSGDKLLNVTVDTGATGGSAVNSGTLTANGGLVVMSASTKDALLNTVVNNSGVIRAQSVVNANGVIRLDGNTVVSSGTLDASGRVSGQMGGTVKLLGDKVTLAAGSKVDVSGDTGGGTVLVGGAYQGSSSEYAAAITTVADGAVITADAISSGNGGKVVVWANDTTTFKGKISARGGSLSGDGGKVEVSGKKILLYQGYTNTTAAMGRTGNLLLDPVNYTVGIGATGANYWNNTDLAEALASNNITIQTAAGAGNGDIIVSAPITWSNGNSLTLSAYRNINVNDNITASGTGNLVFIPGGNLLVGGGAKVSLTGGGKLFISGQQYTLINNLTDWGNMGLSGYYALNADITGVTGPTGTSANPFIGTLDGMGHKVTININGAGGYVGLFGRTETGALLRNVGVGGSITGTADRIGGLVGSNYGGNITNCYSTVDMNMTNVTDIGGLVGRNAGIGVGTGQIINSYSTGAVNSASSSNAGGLVGVNSGGIENCYSIGDVNANAYYAGGLVGENTTSILNSYSTGNTNGVYAGGLVGHNKSATIGNSFSTGKATGSDTGGLIGEQEGANFVSGSFWDKTRSEQASATGSGDIAGATGLTTAQMQTASTFSSWNQTVWKFYDGSSQPLLKNLLKPLTITADAANVSKTYDGQTTSYSGTITYSTGSKPAEVSGTLGYANGGVNVGVYNPTGFFSGQQGYDITVISTGGTLTVNKATLTYTANTANRTYGDANPALNGSVSGFKGSDTLGSATGGTLTWGTTANTGSNVGSYAVNGSGLTAANYDFVQDTSNATALTVNKATLTYTAAAASRTYGDTNPTLSGTISGWKNADNQGNATAGTLSWGTTANTTSNVGSYSINGGGLTAMNYDFAQDVTNATAMTVNKATLTYKATAASRTYGDTSQALSGTISGWKNADNQGNATTGTLSWGTTANSASNVGSYAITGSGLTAANYDFAQAGTNATALTVNKATLTYTANTASKTYGDANPPLNGSVTGFKGSDTLASATGGTLTWGTAANTTSNVGNYAVNGSGLTATNYDFVQNTSNATALTVNKATLTVVANAVSKSYGTDDPTLTYGVSGLVNGDLTGGVLSGNLSRVAGETVAGGPYAINQGTLSANANYMIDYTGANLTILPRALTVIANGATKRVGMDNPAFSATYSGLAAGDTSTALTGALNYNTAATKSSSAGTYAITLTGTLTSPNYTVNYVDGVLTITGRTPNHAYDAAVIALNRETGVIRHFDEVKPFRNTITISGDGVNTDFK